MATSKALPFVALAQFVIALSIGISAMKERNADIRGGSHVIDCCRLGMLTLGFYSSTFDILSLESLLGGAYV
jgi:hypothetical protein